LGDSGGDGKIRRDDVVVAKNYLSFEELDFFNLIVTMYLDYAELQAKNRQVMTMKDWVAKLDAFLKFNGKEVLEHKGKISHEVAIALAIKCPTRFQSSYCVLAVTS